MPSPYFGKKYYVQAGGKIVLSGSTYNPVKTSELNHCYLIDKLLNPQRSWMSDTDMYLPPKVEEGNLAECLNFPCKQHQK